VNHPSARRKRARDGGQQRTIEIAEAQDHAKTTRTQQVSDGAGIGQVGPTEGEPSGCHARRAGKCSRLQKRVRQDVDPEDPLTVQREKRRLPSRTACKVDRFPGPG
jgi:hypothetical protein